MVVMSVTVKLYYFYIKLEHKSGTQTHMHFAGSGYGKSLFLGLFKTLKLLK